jgi:hypothetical protein
MEGGGGGWTTPLPGRFAPGEDIGFPLYKRLGGTQGRSGRVRIISPPSGIRSPDRPASSASLYRLSYPGPYSYSCTRVYTTPNEGSQLQPKHVAENELIKLVLFVTDLIHIPVIC